MSTSSTVMAKDLTEATSSAVMAKDLTDATSSAVMTEDLTDATSSAVMTEDLTDATSNKVMTEDLTDATSSKVVTEDLTDATSSKVMTKDLTDVTSNKVMTVDLTDATSSKVMAEDLAVATSSAVMTDDLTDEFVGLGALPDVPLLQVFSLLSVKERLNCSEVCKRWNTLIYTPSVWSTLNATCKEEKWVRQEMNFYDSIKCSEVSTSRRWLLLQGGYLKILDTTDVLIDVVVDQIREETPLYKKVISEYRLLIGCMENVLPKVGTSVKELFLNCNSGVSTFVFNLYLMLCPNVEKLDARFTGVTENGFEGLAGYGSLRKIKSLNLMGCKRVSDETLENLVACWTPNPEESAEEEGRRRTLDVNFCSVYVHDVCSGFITQDDYVSETCDVDPFKTHIMTFPCPPKKKSYSSGLKFLSLAGCTQITDKGLEYLANCKYVSTLELFDASGCPAITSKGLTLLVKACPRLKPRYLYYCDFISDGPFSQEANGCQTEGGACCMN